VRLTDINQCKSDQKFDTNGELINPYCYADFDQNSTADLCADTYEWTNPGDPPKDINICVAEDGRILTGRTASTRVRWAIKPYTTDPDGDPDTDDGVTSAWVTMAEEKMKAMGTEGIDSNGDPCVIDSGQPDPEDDCTPIDIGKDMWYHTFEFNSPELVQQGLMLNAPAKCTPYDADMGDSQCSAGVGEFYDVHIDEFGDEYYQTEIARRFNLMVQGIPAAMASEDKTSALLIYKEGILFQGGPAGRQPLRLRERSL
jgi:hypothetical protein